MDIIKPCSLSTLGQGEADANETFAAGKAQALAVDAGITGKVVKAGYISLDGDMWTGMFVSCNKDEMENLSLDLYGKMVRITPITLGKARAGGGNHSQDKK